MAKPSPKSKPNEPAPVLKKDGTPRAKMGRPKKPPPQPEPKRPAHRPYKLQPDDKTLKTLEGLGRIQSTTKEAAAVLDVSEPTFLEFIERHEKARETFERAKENGKASLRRAQMKSALDGNVTAQIWLGKQLLGQRDKQELEHTGKDGAPLATETTVIVLPSNGRDSSNEQGG
jgi:hypothetical protein